MVLADDEWPHLFSTRREDVDLPADHVHGSVYLDFDEGVDVFVSQLRRLVPDHAVLAFDEWTHALRRERSFLFAGDPPVDGGRVMSQAKATKTSDELAYMREGLRITEQAIAEVQARIVPGVRQTDLTATFLRNVFDAGADANILDPIWQVMPARLADGPWTTTGDLACPLLSTERELVEGDVLWVDTGIDYEGYASDFGCTFVVGGPEARHRDQAARWREIVDHCLDVLKPGATGGDLVRAATTDGGRRPWLPHLYLAHGIGTNSAEMPLVGTDLGDEFDDALVLGPGMVLVFEPIVWDDGEAGFRAEEIVAVTDDGYERLSTPDGGPRG